MDESDIMQMIVSDQSWEQILGEIITSEGMDPWDLDICKLSNSFSKHISKIDTMDFKLPAKYVIISAVLLRMKSEDLQLLDFGREPEPDFEPELAGPGFERVNVSPLSLPPKRMVHRKIVLEELVSALRRVLDTQERREIRANIRPSIEISDFDITDRIDSLYAKVNGLLAQMDGGDLKFTDIVPKWERNHIVDTFLPLMHLDNERRLNCRQDEFFKDIFIEPMGKNEIQEVIDNEKEVKAKGKPRKSAYAKPG